MSDHLLWLASASLFLLACALYTLSARRWVRTVNEAQQTAYDAISSRSRLLAEMDVYRAVLARLGWAVDIEWQSDGELQAMVRAATRAESAAASDAGPSVH